MFFPPSVKEGVLVRAIEALGTIEPTGPFERALARLLIAAYKRRLQAIVKVVPTWVSEEILSASERIGDRRAVPWLSENWVRYKKAGGTLWTRIYNLFYWAA
jgi:hypothetical protein